MTDEGRDYDDVLAAAQAAGYAEADPTGDVEGHDAVNKLVVLARLAFGVWLDPSAVVIADADGPGPRPARDHRRHGGATSPRRPPTGEVIKLIAGARRGPRTARVDAAVRRDAGRAGFALGRTGGVLNRIEVDAEPVGTVAFSGPGAGGPATSSAVLGDLLAIAARAAAARGRACRRRAAARRAPAHDGVARERRRPGPTLVERYRRVPAGHRRDAPRSRSARASRRSSGSIGSGRGSGSRTSTPRSRARTRPARSRTGAWSSRSRRPLEEGATRDHLRLDRQHLGVGGGVRRSRRPRGRRRPAARPDRDRASSSRRSSPAPGSWRSTATSTRRSASSGRSREQDDHPVTLVNSVNPYRLEGQKTAAFEVCDDLGRAPDVLAIPVGNAGNISAYWAGFRDYAAAGIVGDAAADVRLPGGGRGAARARPAGRAARDDRDRDPDRQPGVVDDRRSRPATRAAARSRR